MRLSIGWRSSSTPRSRRGQPPPIVSASHLAKAQLSRYMQDTGKVLTGTLLGYFALEATPEGRHLVVCLRNKRHQVSASRTRGNIVASSTQIRCKRRRGWATTRVDISVSISAALSNARSTATRQLFSKRFDKRHAGMACGRGVNLETATMARIVIHHALSRHARFANSLIDCKNRRSFDMVGARRSPSNAEELSKDFERADWFAPTVCTRSRRTLSRRLATGRRSDIHGALPCRWRAASKSRTYQ